MSNDPSCAMAPATRLLWATRGVVSVAALAILAGCGPSPGGDVVVYPPPAAVDPPLAGTPGATLGDANGSLLVTLASGGDHVILPVSEHAPGEPWNLRIRGRMYAPGGSRISIRLLRTGVSVTEPPILASLGVLRSRGTFDVTVALPAADFEAVALGIAPGPGSFAIEVVSLSPAVRAGGALQLVGWVLEKGSDAWLLSALCLLGAAVVLGRAALAAAGRTAPAFLNAPRIAASAVALTAIVWSIQAVTAEVRLLAAWSRESREPPRVRPRIAAAAAASRDLALLIEQTVPPGREVAVVPSALSMGTYKLQDAVLPRMIVTTPCEGFARERLPAYVAARPGCFVELLGSAEPAAVDGSERFVAELRTPERRWLRRLTLELRDAAQGEIPAVVRVGGDEVWRGSIAPPGQIDLPSILVDPGRPIGIEILAPARRAHVFALPGGFEALASDAWGHVVARRHGTVPEPTKSFLRREERPLRLRELARLLLALGAATAAGAGFLRILKPAGASRASTLAYGWLLGISTTGLLIHASTLAGLGHWPAPAAGIVVLAAIGWRSWGPAAVRPRGVLQVLLAVVLAVAVVASLVAATRRMPDTNDEMHNWGLPAHLFFHVGPSVQATRAYASFTPVHIAYPPGLSLVETYAALAMGRWCGPGVLLPFPIFLGAMILLVIDGVGREAGLRAGLAVAFLGAAAPLPAAMAVHGMADLPLGCLFAAAVLAVERWDGTRVTAGWLALAGLLAGLMTTYKREGGPLRLVVLVVVAVRILTLPVSWRRVASPVLAFGACVAIASAPWAFAYRQMAAYDWVLNERTADPGNVAAKMSLLPEVGLTLADWLLARPTEGPPWGATYVMLLVAGILAPRSLLRRQRLPSTLGLLAGLVGYCFIYVLSPFGLYHMVSSFGRILLHFFPLAVVLAGRAAADVWAARHGPGGHAPGC